jgi:hypothetical protein
VSIHYSTFALSGSSDGHVICGIILIKQTLSAHGTMVSTLILCPQNHKTDCYGPWLSGMGDREQLSEHGIEPMVHLLGVGTNLQGE